MEGGFPCTPVYHEVKSRLWISLTGIISVLGLYRWLPGSLLGLLASSQFPYNCSPFSPSGQPCSHTAASSVVRTMAQCRGSLFPTLEISLNSWRWAPIHLREKTIVQVRPSNRHELLCYREREMTSYRDSALGYVGATLSTIVYLSLN